MSAARCLAVVATYLREEIEDAQRTLMAGRVVKPDAVESSLQALHRYLYTAPPDVVTDAHSEEAMRAQADVEARFPAAGGR